MPTNHHYHTWIQRISELRPRQRITQVRNFVLLMYGIYQSRSVCLSRIAGKIPGKAKLQSTVRHIANVRSRLYGPGSSMFADIARATNKLPYFPMQKR